MKLEFGFIHLYATQENTPYKYKNKIFVDIQLQNKGSSPYYSQNLIVIFKKVVSTAITW